MKNIPSDFGKGEDKISISQQKGILERAVENAVWKIARWASEEDKKAGKIYSEEEALKLFKSPQFTEIKGNCLLNSGINELWTLVCSSGGTKFDATNAQLGVGDSTTAEDATQTDLQATTNKAYVGMMSGYPTYGTNQKATWKASFDGSTANFAWNEFVVKNGTGGKCLNRKVSAQGTKTAGQVWELSLEITLS